MAYKKKSTPTYKEPSRSEVTEGYFAEEVAPVEDFFNAVTEDAKAMHEEKTQHKVTGLESSTPGKYRKFKNHLKGI